MVFQAWKEYIFEKKAKKIHEFLSSEDTKSLRKIDNVEDMNNEKLPVNQLLSVQNNDDEEDGLIEDEQDFENNFFQNNG